MKMYVLNDVQLSSSTLSLPSKETNQNTAAKTFTKLKTCEHCRIIRDYIRANLCNRINPVRKTNSEKTYDHIKQDFLKQKNDMFEIKVAKKTFNLDEKKGSIANIYKQSIQPYCKRYIYQELAANTL